MDRIADSGGSQGLAAHDTDKCSNDVLTRLRKVVKIGAEGRGDVMVSPT